MRASAGRIGAAGRAARRVRLANFRLVELVHTCFEFHLAAAAARATTATVATAAVAATVATTVAIAAPARLDRLVRIVAALAEILGLDVADVQEPISADAEIDERRLDARLDVDDFAFIDIADVIILAGSLDIEFFEYAVFHDRNAAFLRLRNVDQHFLLHVESFLFSAK